MYVNLVQLITKPKLIIVFIQWITAILKNALKMTTFVPILQIIQKVQRVQTQINQNYSATPYTDNIYFDKTNKNSASPR